MHTLIHPTSALYGMGDLPSYVIYNELLMTSTEYLVCVTAVDPFWLMESGLLLYDIQRIEESKETADAMFERDVVHDSSGNEVIEARKIVLAKLDKCLKDRKALVERLRLDNEKQSTTKMQGLSTPQDKGVVHPGKHTGIKRRRPFF